MKYRFENCEFDTGARTLTRDGACVHVEPQVFDLIQHLIENRARVVDKDELLARVWKGRIVSDATIASRINAARHALGDDGRSQRIIATQSRHGFRLVARVTADTDSLRRPAVAVMPFDVLTEGKAELHLARGIAEQLAATLGQAAWFDVRDTTASFAASLDGLPLEDVSKKLLADYLVLGTLQISGAAIRISVRLVDPLEARQVWASSSTGQRDELFALQDDLASNVLGAVEPRLRNAELQRSAARHGNLSAFDHYLRAIHALRPMDLPAMRAASDELEKALVAFPEYPAAHGMLAWIGTLLLPQGHRVDVQKAREQARRAVKAGAFDHDALALGGYAIGFFEREPVTALAYLHRALALNPSSARAHDHAGWLLLYAGKPCDALLHFERAVALCPLDEFGFRMLTGRAFAHLYQRNFDAAILDAQRAHLAAPSYSVCHRVLAAALAHIGRETEARAILKELLAINPGLSLARYARETRFEGTQDREILFSGLKRSGLPS